DGMPDEGEGMPDDGEGMPPLGDGIPLCGPDIDCWLAHAARPAALPATRISWSSLLRIAHLGRYREATTTDQPSLVTLRLPEVQPTHGRAECTEDQHPLRKPRARPASTRNRARR